MRRFSKWAKKHLSARSHPKDHSEDRPSDALPLRRTPRRPLTPDFIDTAASLFQLPWDIRSQILDVAFGGRILHVDLVPGDKALRWKGLVCYQGGPEFPRPWLWNDYCVQDKYPPQPPYGDIVGIMGFLLSCKQAYKEGIGFLYSANTIQIQSEILLLNLPRLVPTQRLASITSLDIHIDAHYETQYDNGRPFLDFDHLQPILNTINTHCSSLRSFGLALMIWRDENTIQHDFVTGPALSVLDAFYRAKNLRTMRVELPSWLLSELESAGLCHRRKTPNRQWDYCSKWRCLDGGDQAVQSRSDERSPLTPLDLPLQDDDVNTDVNRGYWLFGTDQGPQIYQLECGNPPSLIP